MPHLNATLPMPARRDPSRRYHDRVARRYDTIYDDPYWAFHDEVTWRVVKPHLPRDLTVPCADLGCGTGKWGLRLLKSGFAVSFVDHSAAMIGQTRTRLQEMGARAAKATTLVGDIVAMPDLPSGAFGLVLAMGDPLSICTDPPAAAREMARITRPGGIVIATADNKLAAIDHYAQAGKPDELLKFLKTGRTHWLTDDQREQFELTTFTPTSLRKLFERAGLEVLGISGKTVLPVRKHPELISDRDSMEQLVHAELELAREPTSAGRCSHLQAVCRRPE